MIQHIEIPREVPVMTLGSAVLFPQAMMPLYIFEPRYKEMIRHILPRERIFAVAALDESAENAAELETPHSVAGVGVVRACKENDDGTFNLILQGLARVEFEAIVSETPYRRARIRQLPTETGGPETALSEMKDGILDRVRTQMRLGAEIPEEVFTFLQNLEDAETVLDLAIHTLGSPPEFKQELLETRETLARYERFRKFLEAEIERIKLENELRGGKSDDAIGDN